jgi:hypothetical protein
VLNLFLRNLQKSNVAEIGKIFNVRGIKTRMNSKDEG